MDILSFNLMLTLCILMQGPGPDARIVYIDGAFDLFHAGHVEVQHVVSLLLFLMMN